MDTKLYVGNLSYDTSEDELRELFSRAGSVTSVILIKDRDTMRSKGFGFIEMSSQSEAEAAIKMFDGFSFGPREIRVNKARPPEERSFSRPDQRYGSKGGGGGGGGGKNRKPRSNEGYKSRRY